MILQTRLYRFTVVSKILFTDIDGTMIDVYTAGYGNSKRVINQYRELLIPVILCSAKTIAEQEFIRKETGLLNEPFIVENGGAIVIPENYFDFEIEGSKSLDNYSVIELGKPAKKVNERLEKIRTENKITFTTVLDVSIEKLARIVNLPLEYAERMSMRRYGQTILEIGKNEVSRFQGLAAHEGLKVIHGGRFFDVTFGNDKGIAVERLMVLIKKKYGERLMSFGIGDSKNDISMLAKTDIKMLVQKPGGVWEDIGMDNIILLPGVGPEGWEKAFEIIVKWQINNS